MKKNKTEKSNSNSLSITFVISLICTYTLRRFNNEYKQHNRT